MERHILRDAPLGGMLQFCYERLRFTVVFREDFFTLRLGGGTLAPARRAEDSPIAIACLRLVTFFLLLPLRNVPVLYSCITFFTFFCDTVFFLGHKNFLLMNNYFTVCMTDY